MFLASQTDAQTEIFRRNHDDLVYARARRPSAPRRPAPMPEPAGRPRGTVRSSGISGALPWQLHRRHVGVTFYGERQLRPAAGRKFHRETAAADRLLLSVDIGRFDPVLAKGPALHDHGVCILGTDVDQRYGRHRVRHRRHQCRHIIRYAGAALLRIEVAQPCLQQPAVAAGHQPALHEVCE